MTAIGFGHPSTTALFTAAGLTTTWWDTAHVLANISMNPFAFTVGAAVGVVAASWMHATLTPNAINEDEAPIEIKSLCYSAASGAAAIPSLLGSALKSNSLVSGLRAGFMTMHAIRHVQWMHSISQLSPHRQTNG